MSKTLVAYFSATGTTEKLARKVAEAAGGTLHQIQPEIPYTSADLDWTDSKSRSSVEMNDKSFRPAISNQADVAAEAETLILLFPIWWYIAPTIVNTFLEQYDWTGKTIIPVATSGGSGMGNTNQELAPSCPGAVLKEGRRFDVNVSGEELKAWLGKLGL